MRIYFNINWRDFLWKILTCLLLILFFIFYCISPCFAEATTYVWSSDLGFKSIETASEINTEVNSLSLESASAILIEQTTGQILYVECGCHGVYASLEEMEIIAKSLKINA